MELYQHPEIPGTYTLEHWLTEYPDLSPYALIEVSETESGDFEPVSQMFARY